ncbi:uracil-DNA glycosylase-like protein [Gottschalkia acidurici 9a]|uniref:Uracil-DNA glycosylase-like protein n=1 Tax=Gottschalkia acidurici (strain ATCC 7906 / DSM 604 / BCRC 14475 / CIP 104303 / KCTC 5404 / NCIMB 10678 / 9a) TaxID=1128398 RepID=K0B2R2_GOTA9|nr:uracil-DNA glycosylase [Gottschalkia acidurici]AFS79784.1 uracil-DNA glycosylase-like protein [Gottschalkia acidurici 9a]
MNNLKTFVEELANMEVTPNVYNQYSYKCQENSVRRNNLLIYLKQMYKLKPKIILVGEAPGYRGCRLTGVPFTSEHLLMNNIEGLELFGKDKGYRLAVEKDKLLKEATATMIWRTLLEYNMMTLSWNAFPFHPHKKDNEESNRTPLKKELLIGEKPLLQMIEMFNIQKLVAVGNKAHENLSKLGITCEKVRHPAQGGKNEFVEGIRSIKEKLDI